MAVDGILLTLRLQAGEPRAFDEVVRRHHDTVFRQLWHLSGSIEIAADLTQETFVQASRSVKTVRSSVSLRAWLSTILLRVWSAWTERDRVAGQVETVPLESLIDTPAEPASDPTDRLHSQTAAVREAVLLLADSHRVPLVLYYFEDMKYREIADVLSLPIGTVKSRLHSALRQLEELLKDDASDRNGPEERR